HPRQQTTAALQSRRRLLRVNPDGGHPESARKSRRALVLVVFLMFFAGGFIAWKRMFPARHQHCIKQAYFTLAEYAAAHGGKFPASDRGWADALLLLAADENDDSWIPWFVGVDDDGSLYREALLSGKDIPESQASRIYVQGLTKDSPPEAALLFDRHSVKGGDHHRGLPGRPELREVLLVDGSFRTIPDKDWAAFACEQIKLLIEAGMPSEQAESFFMPTLENPH